LGWLRDRSSLPVRGRVGVGEKSVDASVVEIVLSIAAENGDRALFDGMISAARATSNRRERRQILEALGSFRDPELLRAALGSTLSDAFDVRESFWMVRSAQTTGPTREIVYDFVKQNYDALTRRLPDDSAPEKAIVANWIGRNFCDDAHAADLESFFRERSAHLTGGPRHLAQAVEAVRLCSAHRALQEPNVSAFLQKR
ncbi:MAG TPA: ERAP1-like C-terminal domain-containing protein, partial [Polyangiaceae bacterium]|nr:ERAP1-like C-terminal domain-containing protein [Polyangiaceae bacterium]